MTNKLSNRNFQCFLYYKCLLWLIEKLNWLPTVNCKVCNFYICHACTCYYRLPLAWAKQQGWEIHLSEEL